MVRLAAQGAGELPGYVPLIPFFPMAGALLLLLFRRAIGRWAGIIASSVIGSSFVLSLMAVGDLMTMTGAPEERMLAGPAYEWIAAGGMNVAMTFKVDALTAVMLLIVTGVGTLIHIYSIGYMEHDDRKATYFGYLNLFAGSMLLLVLANNFLVLYVGWELVGLCSYLLISFWYFKPEAAAAGKKAFLVNRIGDVGFLIGILLIYAHFGTLDFDEVFARASELQGAIVTAIPLLLFVGAVGKSAQIPLHIWLPDAMEGPTPVSALIHAATMVTAGVYMVARAHVFFEASHVAALTVATIGAVTALFAATVACLQDDIKRVLAYSTISQLGFMFLAVGVGALSHSPVAYAAAIFHLVTHAFFKALLFLGAGSVMHAMEGETNMKKMGGLIKTLPRTGWTFIIGWLAILGIPPLSGFFSKDAILVSTYEEGWFLLWLIASAAALLTAFYMSRQVFLVFFGKSRHSEDVHPHESPSVMTGPLVVLAGLTATAGMWLGLTHDGPIFRLLEPLFGVHEEAGAEAFLGIPETGLVEIAVALSILGMFFAWRLYLARGGDQRRAALQERWSGVAGFVRSGYRLDDLYGALLVWPGKTIANVAAYAFDVRVIDGAVNGLAVFVGRSAEGVRRVQSGLVRRYVMAMLTGVVVLLALFIARAN